MKILIFGAGSIGTALGAFLRKGGAEVFLIGRKPHVEAIRKNGVRVTGIWGEHHIGSINAYSSLSEVKEREFDGVFLTVKSFDTLNACEELKREGVQSKIYISFQNGLGNVETVQKIFGEEKSAGARVIFGARLTSPGEVKITVYADRVAIGPLSSCVSSEQKNILLSMVKMLNDCLIPSFFTDSVLPYLWSKILYNAPLNPLSALFQCPYGELLENPHTRKIMRSVIEECFSVASSELGEKMLWRNVRDYINLFEEELVPSTSSHFASMAEDIKRRGKTEIDSINGEVVRRGMMRGIPVRVNMVLLELIKGMEKNFVRYSCNKGEFSYNLKEN